MREGPCYNKKPSKLFHLSSGGLIMGKLGKKNKASKEAEAKKMAQQLAALNRKNAKKKK